jgi:hypothetical protein
MRRYGRCSCAAVFIFVNVTGHYRVLCGPQCGSHLMERSGHDNILTVNCGKGAGRSTTALGIIRIGHFDLCRCQQSINHRNRNPGREAADRIRILRPTALDLLAWTSGCGSSKWTKD